MRTWDTNKPKVLFIMLNPSTADANNDDPTIRRCKKFAESWGFGSLYVANLFAFRSTEPKHLLNAEDPIGELNTSHLQTISEFVDLIVCAWGNAEIVYKITDKFPDYNPFDNINKDLFYIDLSNSGVPKHPLYLRKDLFPSRLFFEKNQIIKRPKINEVQEKAIKSLRNHLKNMPPEELQKLRERFSDNRPKGWLSIDGYLPMMLAKDIMKGYSTYKVKDKYGNEFNTHVSDHNIWYYEAKELGITHWLNE